MEIVKQQKQEKKDQQQKHTVTKESKLMAQLQKQSRNTQKAPISQDRIDDVYQILTKIQSKNLNFIELLIFLIEKGFLRNEHKMHYYMDLYDSIRETAMDELPIGHKGKPEDQDKFSRKKFVKVFKEIAKKFYPCDPQGFENHIYGIIAGNQNLGQIRIKIDDSVRKILSKEIVNGLRNYEKELQILFQIYMPQNYNMKLGFTWNQIKYLQKKLPIISVFRLLWDCEICPHYISPSHFFEVASKLIPPHSLLVSTGQKEGQFYSPQNITSYVKESVNQKKIKLLDGDIGVNFFQFGIFLIRLSIDVTKDKADFLKAFQNFMGLINLKETIQNKGQTKNKPNRFQQAVKAYFDDVKKSSKKNNFQVQKTETKKKIEEIMQASEQAQQETKNQFKNSESTLNDLIAIKKGLDQDHLPIIPEKSKVQKENDANYNIQSKHIVIGQQLPKLPEKNKPAAAPKKNDKKDDLLKKFKFEQPTLPKISTDYYNQIVKVPKKPRINQQFPVILMDAVYPSDVPGLELNQKCQIFLETTYIHLGERSYEKAYVSYVKARSLYQNLKNQTVQFFFLILEAQIYEAAARDSMALLNYHKAKELAKNMLNKDSMLKYIAYKGLGCCLYHIQQYQYALRCFLKARQCRFGQIQLQSVENAVIQNNIGCIYMIMDRNFEAMKHFELSERIMDLKLGKFHERSVVVQQNDKKNKKAYIELAPEYKTMWRTFVQKPGLKPAVKTNKKK